MDSLVLMAAAERRALRRIVDAADVIVVDGQNYILAPVDHRTLEVLAAFDEHDGREPEEDNDDDAEMEPDREDDDPKENDDPGGAGVGEDDEPDYRNVPLADSDYPRLAPTYVRPVLNYKIPAVLQRRPTDVLAGQWVPLPKG